MVPIEACLDGLLLALVTYARGQRASERTGESAVQIVEALWMGCFLGLILLVVILDFSSVQVVLRECFILLTGTQSNSLTTWQDVP